jgi:hypothetical protein
MSHIALFSNDGELVQSIRCPSEELEHYSNYIFLRDDEQLVQDEYYIPNIHHPVKTKLPDRPTIYHVFDYTIKDWVISVEQLDLAKSDKKAAIVEHMNTIRYSPIPFDGKLLDANETSQINIAGKISQLQNELALALPSNDLFWKDADNIIHTWTDPAVYLEWLRGLQVQIATRTTELYNKVWQAKTTIDNMNDINDVINFNIDNMFG